MAARKTSTTPTRIYRFGALAPRDEAEVTLIREEVFRANRLRNALVAIERERRTEYREIRASLSADLLALEAEHERLEAEIAVARRAVGAVPKSSPQRQLNA